MQYKIIDWQDSNKLRKENVVRQLETLDFNLSTVWLMRDSSFLVTPLNPFGRSIIVYSQEELKAFLDAKQFPLMDSITSFYYDNKNQIDDLINFKDSLKAKLIDVIYGDSVKNLDNLDAKDIDYIYKQLRSKRNVDKYKLNFIVLVGDYFIHKEKDRKYNWGLVRKKMFLNPQVSIVLTVNESQREYFDLEEALFGKYGYMGLESTMQVFNNTKIGNEIEEVYKTW